MLFCNALQTSNQCVAEHFVWQLDASTVALTDDKVQATSKLFFVVKSYVPKLG